MSEYVGNRAGRPDRPVEHGGPPAGAGDRLPVSRRPRGGEQHDRGPEDPFGPSAPATFERVPPQDLDAEQSVLGGMMLSKDAIADVVEVLKGHDFYRPAHETIYGAILDLYAKGEPADPITVAAELTKRSEITRVGGASYLHTLVQTVPTAANAEYYAEIVHQRAILRRLVEAGTRITQMGYAADGEVDEIVNSAQAEIYAVTEARTAEDYLPLSDIMEGALDEIEAIGSRSGQMSGVPTGFTDLDSLTNGLHPGQMVVIAARPAMGKALALDTPLPTPSGWTTMSEVREGDFLLGADGVPTRVVAATGVLTGRPCFEVVFDDGTTVVADADHQWLTRTWAERQAVARFGADDPRSRAAVRTTKELAETQRCTWPAEERPNHSVAAAAPLELPERDVPVAPYDLGLGLGSAVGGGSAGAAAGVPGSADGPSRIAPPRIAPSRIPSPYLRGSHAQRRAVLAGLVDAGAAVMDGGSVRFRGAGGRLPEGVGELMVSLGYRRAAGSGGVGFVPGERVVSAVREVASVPVRCVQVDGPDRLYLATRSMVPTHNSTLALDFARACSIKNNLPSVIFSLEMGRNEIAMRLLSAEARVALHHMRSGSMTDDDWTRLARRMPEVTEAPLYIDDSPNLSMMEIRAKCRRLRQRNDLQLVVIDYLQLMQTGGSRRPESRQQEVSEMSRNLKLLAKELEVPVVALSQLNRGPEQRTDKKPMVSDLRESGSIEQDADMVILLHREDAYEKESPRAGEADLIVAKHRNGPTATITVAFQGHYSRFVDMQA